MRCFWWSFFRCFAPVRECLSCCPSDTHGRYSPVGVPHMPHLRYALASKAAFLRLKAMAESISCMPILATPKYLALARP